MGQSIWVPANYSIEVPPDASFHTYILKVAARCNLACPYCYVYEGPDQSWRTRPKFMSDETARQTFARIAEHLKEKGGQSISLTLHGGEPLLCGPNRLRAYLEAAVELIPAEIEFSLQTNGTLLTEEFLNLFAQFGVKIGLSIDGGRAANDRYRRFKNGRSSFDRVISAIDLINSKPEWRTLLSGYLAVVDLQNDPREIFEFISGLDCRGFDVLLPDCNHEAPPPRPKDDHRNVAYGKWMADLFDIWLDGGKDIEVCYIEEIMAMLFGQPSTREHIGSRFADLIIIESDGDIEGVDTLKMVSKDATNLGLNVFNNTFTEALSHDSIACRLVGFDALCSTCRSCSYLDQCGGGYLPHRYRRDTGFLNPSVYCNDIQHLIDHMKIRLSQELRETA